VSGVSRICLVAASGENVFFGEILDAFGEALREHGFEIEHSVDCFPPPADDLVCLFIPHEFMALVDPLAHPTPTQMRRTVAISTEQPGTSWFDVAVEAAARAGAVVDINRLAAEEMNRLGIPTAHVQLGYIPGWDAWGGSEEKEREVDMTFLGRYTLERAELIGGCVGALEYGRAAVYMTETIRPHVAGSAYYLAGERRSRALANSKTLVNIHQQELPYLEWHRILSAVLNGCVVISEHSLMTEPFLPGRDFVSARREDIPHVLEGLLAHPDRLREIRHSAYDLVREQMPMSAATAVMLDAIERAAANPVEVGPLGPSPAVPMPKPLPEPKPGWETYAEGVGPDLPTRQAMKDVTVRLRALERRVDQVLDGAAAPDRITVETLGPAIEKPRVSVLLTVYNHAELVGAAIRSIGLGELRDVELIAVDDGSFDDSAEAVRRACAEAPWLSAKLVRRSSNSGLPAASRNLAFEHARGDLLFVLDADNTALPLGPAKLAAALDEDPEAGFAYGIIEKFDSGGPLDLVSWLDWDPERLRYGNYIDAMAMVRRSALEAVGGYPTVLSLAGWEDFALWIGMAEQGIRGIRLPDFVGRYRVSQSSMLSIMNLDQSSAWTTLLRAYPQTLHPGTSEPAAAGS
jgi:hypothetical protein